mgnify:CR=1 FL=1
MSGEMGVFLALTGWEMNGVDAKELGLTHYVTPTESNQTLFDTFWTDLQHYTLFNGDLEFTKGQFDTQQ